MRTIYLFLSLLLLSGCAKNYFISPYYGNGVTYKSLPMLSDSIKNRLYAGGALSTGSVNNQLRDHNSTLHLQLYNTHSFNKLQLWYGGGLSVGLYHVGAIDSSYEDFQYFDERKGYKFYSGFTTLAGLTYSIPINSKTEWRILGVQATLQREYANYLRFRKLIKEDEIWISGLSVNPWLLTVSFSSEICWKTNTGNLFYLGQINLLTGKEYKYSLLHNPLNPNDKEGGRYAFFTNTFGLETKKASFFMQGYIGQRLIGVQLGTNIPLLTNKKL